MNSFSILWHKIQGLVDADNAETPAKQSLVLERKEDNLPRCADGGHSISLSFNTINDVCRGASSRWHCNFGIAATASWEMVGSKECDGKGSMIFLVNLH